MNGQAILRAVKGIVAGELGTLRKVTGAGGQPLCTYSPAILEVENPIEDRAFFTAGHWFDIVLGDDVGSESTPFTVLGNRSVDSLSFSVELLSSGGKAEDFSIVLQGSIVDASRKIRAALGYPDNLTVDDRGEQTAIVNGRLGGPGGQILPVVRFGQRDCHLMRWRVDCVATLDIEQEV
jgi:hypothetical protein